MKLIKGKIKSQVTGSIPAGDNNIGNVDLASEIPAGIQVIGKVGIDQTTQGTTNLIVSSAKHLGLALHDGDPNPTSNDITVQQNDTGSYRTPIATDYDIRDAEARTFKIPMLASGYTKAAIHCRIVTGFDQVLTFQILPTSALISANSWPPRLTFTVNASAANVYWTISDAASGQGATVGGATLATGTGSTFSVPNLGAGGNLLLRLDFAVAPGAGNFEVYVERWRS